MFGLLLVVILGAFLYWRALVPTHEGEWQALQARLPEASLHQGYLSQTREPQASADTSQTSDYIRLRGVRDFRYHPDGSIAEGRYLEGDYYLQDLKGVWLGISHFGEPGLAHTFLSFEFSEDNFLVASIEARLRPEQSYHPLLGLVRQYPRLLVWGTEADIIGLRTHVRKERVLLYPLRLSPEQAQGLLVALTMETAELSKTPDFYNTLTDNCATGLLKFEPDYRWYASLMDYRILLPGFVDGLLLERGWIAAEGSLTDLRQRASVAAETAPPTAEHFSAALRSGWR